MANEKKEVSKKGIDKEPVTNLSKEELKAKKENEKRSKAVAVAKKPKKSPIKFFKEARSEFKKVSWPAPKQVVNNTGVVLTTIVIAGVSIWLLDKGFDFIIRFILVK